MVDAGVISTLTGIRPGRVSRSLVVSELSVASVGPATMQVRRIFLPPFSRCALGKGSPAPDWRGAGVPFILRLRAYRTVPTEEVLGFAPLLTGLYSTEQTGEMVCLSLRLFQSGGNCFTMFPFRLVQPVRQLVDL